MIIRLTGSLLPEEIHAYPSRLLGHEGYDPTYDELIDARLADVSNIPIDAIRRMVVIHREVFDEDRHKIAFVVEGDLMYGMARQYIQLGIDAPNNRRIFRDPEAAHAWLEASDDGSDR